MPTADDTEKRPPTQSQKPKAFCACWQVGSKWRRWEKADSMALPPRCV